MLALKSKIKLTLMLVGSFMWLAGPAMGQQTPSQRYQPVRDLATQSPPSVHVPHQPMKQLPPKFRAANTNYQVAPTGKQPSSGGTSFNFSDQATAQRGTLRSSRTNFESSNSVPNYQPGTIQQTSYQVDDKGQPVVPDILSGGKANGPMTQQSGPQFQAPSNIGAPPMVEEMPRKTPQDFAAAMDQVRGKSPRIAPAELASQSENISAQMAELRRRAEEKANAEKAQAIAEQAAAEQREIDRLEADQQNAQRIAAEKLAAAQMEDARRTEAMRMQTANVAANRVVQENAAAEKMAQPQAKPEISASEFIGQIAPKQPKMAPVQDSKTSPRLVATQVGEVPAVMQLANDHFDSQPVRDSQVVPASTTQEAEVQTTPSFTLGTPAIAVETYGPKTVGINKPANYQVVVRNEGKATAERILVGINVPQWIDIENVNLTTGGKEITDGQDQARLVWSIDKIPGNSSQTITITAVPRRAEVFEVGVEWTLVPRVGKTNVDVTEPKLEMNIAGPKEVQYGETALYHVTVRNPGTGSAENVIVMLPEALGGERATLGNIDAGKEKNFQVELLARTAGDLNLVATAAADGSLRTSAERALTVRRANLEISLQGPGLKYAGSMAKYHVDITNTGDAIANDVVTAVALPTGVKYVSGVDAVKLIEGGMRWPVGTLEPGQTRTFKFNCQLDTSGDLQLEVGAKGRGDLAASSACLTTVETIEDLVLSVADPKGPLPTGEEVIYQIKVQNRGSKSARDVNLVMQFSEGIEPKTAHGLEHKIVPGQVLFSQITQIDPGQEMSFNVSAEALKSGTHVFRAQLTSDQSDAREIAEGTTRFFGESVQPIATANSENTNNFESNDFGTEFKR